MRSHQRICSSTIPSISEPPSDHSDLYVLTVILQPFWRIHVYTDRKDNANDKKEVFTMGLIKLIVGLIGGVVGLVVGLVGGAIGLVVGLFGAVFGIGVAVLVGLLLIAPLILVFVLIF